MAAFGRYQLIRRVGLGASAEVWKARLDGPGGFQKSLAIKKIPPARLHDAELLARFVEEARLVADLVHPNVVQVVDFGQAETGEYFIAMEYVAGVDLARLLRRAREALPRIPPELALFIVRETSRGLGCAHDKGVVHRAVSPQNILVSFGGEVKLADFGLARLTGAAPRTVAGVVRGDVSYLNPEQAAADPSVAIDARSDIFSLGVVLYEMLVGRLPVPEATPARLREFRGLPPDALAPVTGALRDIVARMLHREPGERFANARELEAELAAAAGVEVLVGGRQVLAALMGRLFGKELEDEVEEERGTVTATNFEVDLGGPASPAPTLSPGRAAAGAGERPSVTPESLSSPPSSPTGEPVSSTAISLVPGPDEPISATAIRVTTPPAAATARPPDVIVEAETITTAPALALDLGTGATAPLEATAAAGAGPAADEGVSRTMIQPFVPRAAGNPAPATGASAHPDLFPAQKKGTVGPHEIAVAALAAILAGSVVPLAYTLQERSRRGPIQAGPASYPTPVIEELPPEPELAPAATRLASNPSRSPTQARTGAGAPPSPPPSPSPETSPEVAPDIGRLRIVGDRSCEIYVDRVKVADRTPFTGDLSAGMHTLGFFDPASGLWLEQKQYIPAGGTLTLRVLVGEARVVVER